MLDEVIVNLLVEMDPLECVGTTSFDCSATHTVYSMTFQWNDVCLLTMIADYSVPVIIDMTTSELGTADTQSFQFKDD